MMLSTDPKKETELLRLCSQGRLDEGGISRFRQLIRDKECVDINCTDTSGNTPIILLCKNNQSDSLYQCVEFLLLQRRQEVEINKKDPAFGSNALMSLCLKSSSPRIFQVAKLLIKKGIDVNQSDNNGYNALMLLCWSSKSDKIVKIAKLLIEKGTQINHRNNYENNALTALCYNSTNEKIVQVAKLLIDQGISINQKNKYGNNALTALCFNSMSDKIIQVAKLLISKGVNIDHEDGDGSNALIMLCRHSSNEKIVQVVELLVKKGIDSEQKDKAGNSAVDYISTRNVHEISNEKKSAIVAVLQKKPSTTRCM